MQIDINSLTIAVIWTAINSYINGQGGMLDRSLDAIEMHSANCHPFEQTREYRVPVSRSFPRTISMQKNVIFKD